MTPDFNHVNMLTEDVEKILNTWNKGIDISSYSQDQMARFSDFLDKSIMESPLDYSLINFELLMKTGVSFKAGDVIQIDNGFIKLSAGTKSLIKKSLIRRILS